MATDQWNIPRDYRNTIHNQQHSHWLSTSLGYITLTNLISTIRLTHLKLSTQWNLETVANMLEITLNEITKKKMTYHLIHEWIHPKNKWRVPKKSAYGPIPFTAPEYGICTQYANKDESPKVDKKWKHSSNRLPGNTSTQCKQSITQCYNHSMTCV